MNRLRRFFLAWLGLLALAGPSFATWSIVCVNVRTREVAVATATCLANFNIRVGVPVIVVGEGAAAAQSLLDAFGTNRQLIYFSFRDTAETPSDILSQLADMDFGHGTRQYGIVNFEGAPVTFTGPGAGAAASGVTGQVGDYIYAIQGNVLTGDEVVLACEAAFRTSLGDMGQKMMAAMHAARGLGGDGRCSCSNNNPTGCGVPPDDFSHSAYAATIVLARIGDANGGCNPNRGCAKGDYYMKLNVIGNPSDPDPVFRLQDRYDTWRRGLLDVPDGILSKVAAAQVMPADGATQTTVQIQLSDVDGVALSHDDARVYVKAIGGSFAGGTIGDVINHGKGRYSFPLVAGNQPGVESYLITAVVGGVTATLYPHLEVEYVAPLPLTVGMRSVSAAEGGQIPFTLDIGQAANAPYWILAAYDGSEQRLGRLCGALSFVPLAVSNQSPFYPAAPLLLDGSGRAQTTLSLAPGMIGAFVGGRMAWEGLALGATGAVLTDTWITEILP